MTNIVAEAAGNRSGEGRVGAAGEEKRQDHRRRTLKEGRIALNNWSTIDCVIRDLSSGGAHLRFSGPTTLPDTFRLIIVKEGTTLPVKLLWQRGLSAGVALAGPES